MASTKRAAGRASAGAAATTTTAGAEEPSKAELQRRMEETREDISQTVEEIKETVTGTVESVKETVAETFDWRAQFRKHSVAWSLGALAVGYVVGTGLAAALKDTTKEQKGRKSRGLLDDIYAYGEVLAEEFSGAAQTIILPLINKKIKDSLGIDLSDKLLTTRAARAAAGKLPAKKSAKKAGAKKGAAKKAAGKKRAAKKGGSK
ncbi:MAG TPA: hypothetical protein VN256_09805 [Pyrinomonadaceae bacterium]|nr:hypothetical protein [Pyrinomonadaceae bacterium]